MRISIPTLPTSLLTSHPSTSTHVSTSTSIPTAIDRIASFLASGNVAVLTGAGVSVDSGIRAYRGKDGRYLNPGFKPILYQQLVDETEKGYSFRQRYWLRSYLGYPPVRDALPNPTHYAIAALQRASLVTRLITQNVDGLHLKALSLDPAGHRPRSSGSPHPVRASPGRSEILELHGTLHKAHCSHSHRISRSAYQDLISFHNPQWATFAEEMERTGTKPRMNPDGDVMLEGVAFDDFVVPECAECSEEGRHNSILKPDVIFFGESISQTVKDLSFRYIETCDRLFVIGTTLATFSAFRLLKRALELSKPILILNVGPTRADSIRAPGLEKIELRSGDVLGAAVKAVLGSRATSDPILAGMLNSGVVKSLDEVDEAETNAVEDGKIDSNTGATMGLMPTTMSGSLSSRSV